jgi:hypothetical protein
MLDEAPRQRKRCRECKKPLPAVAMLVEGTTLDAMTVDWLLCGPCGLIVAERPRWSE